MPYQDDPSGLVPKQLLEYIQKGDYVLFLGADLPLGYPGAPLSRSEMAQLLAEKCSLPAGLGWPETATAYLGKHTNDLQGITEFVLRRSAGEAGPLHQAVARAGFRAIITAWYGEQLELALKSAGYRVHRVVNDRQLPYCENGDRDVTVVKLYGCISEPGSLILTHRQHIQLISRLSRRLESVISWVTMRPLLFIGHNPSDQTLMAMYDRASEGVVEHMRRAYAVWPEVSDAARGDWAGLNIEFLPCAPTPFLVALAAQVPAARAAGTEKIRVRKPPYKFLDYYTPADFELFCGRDIESQNVARQALNGRLLTLFGPSGAGKTSLLLAGVVPRLAREGYQYLYMRALDDPLSALCKALSERTGNLIPSTSDLRSCLESALGPQDRLLIIFDQFEELFLRVGSRSRSLFFAQLAAALSNPTRDVRFIFSLREEYLARLDEARTYFPEIFNNSFRLPELDRNHARVAITEPAARAEVTVEPALVDALVGAFAARKGDAGGGDLVDSEGCVSPPAMQIVLNRLYRAALPPELDLQSAPPPGTTLTLSVYRSFTCCVGEGENRHDLHGAGAILVAYVEEGLAELPKLSRPGGGLLGAQVNLGRAVLKVMVTSRATKAALSAVEIQSLLEEAGEIDLADPVDLERLEATRQGLQQVRLLRSFERDGQPYYELSHDYLALAISGWLTESEVLAKVARELLRRAMDNWRTARLLVPLEALKIIHERRKELKRLSKEELELLLRSALAAGYEAGYWFERGAEGGVDVRVIAEAGLKAEKFRSRAAAASTLGGLGVQFIPALCGMLGDEYPQVRAAAIQALEKLEPGGEWRGKLKYECYVPAGRFRMGEGKDEHTIFAAAFYMAKYPTTNAEYQRYRKDIGQPFSLPVGKENHPVVEISWYDARDYAAWAGMRLPTEAEWEKAAGWDAGRKEKRVYPWGDAFDQGRCNTGESGLGGTSPVGKYSPGGDSPYGCADMAGNVWEWCSSEYRDYPYKTNDGREKIIGSGARVLRGGSWFGYRGSARCASRNDSDPLSRTGAYGFRECLSPSALESDNLGSEL